MSGEISKPELDKLVSAELEATIERYIEQRIAGQNHLKGTHYELTIPLDVHVYVHHPDVRILVSEQYARIRVDNAFEHAEYAMMVVTKQRYTLIERNREYFSDYPAVTAVRLWYRMIP